MCGRYTQLSSVREILAGVDTTAFMFDRGASYNIAPTDEVAVIINDNGYKAMTMQWGLIPSWAKDDAMGRAIINARAETLLEKPTFKHAIKRRRCLIPADGFYEWYDDGTGKKPYYIRLKSKEPFCFAGIYDTWRTPTDALLITCAIITTTPNELIARIHNRMPVILHKEDYQRWLDAPPDDVETVMPLLAAYPADEMEMYEVSRMVNSPKNDTPQLIQPVSAEHEIVKLTVKRAPAKKKKS